MTTKPVRLSCVAGDCSASHFYSPACLRVLLYTHGICAVAWVCATCKGESQITVPDRVAIYLDGAGAPTTVVHTPEEVFEWPDHGLPITEHDVGMFERSSVTHVNECAVHELFTVDSG